MLMRSFTRREKIMLVVLVLVMLVGLYFLAVHNPVKNNLARLAQEQEDTELQLQVAEIKMAKYNSMKKELEEIFAMPRDQITVMPPYDNAEALMVQLNHILGELEYNLSFSNVVFNEGVAARAVQFTFDAPSYEQARTIIERLTHTGNRSLMNTLTIAPAQNTSTGGTWGNINDRGPGRGGSAQQSANILVGPLQVSGTITFYESAPGMGVQQSEE